MALNLTAIEGIADIIIAFVPIMLLVCIIGWLMETFKSGF